MTDITEVTEFVPVQQREPDDPLEFECLVCHENVLAVDLDKHTMGHKSSHLRVWHTRGAYENRACLERTPQHI